MAISIFDHKESAYHAWLRSNPDGYVLNVFRRRPSTFARVHRSSCVSLRRTGTRSTAAEPFTSQDYIKVCADGGRDLLRWSADRGDREPRVCQRCAPDLDGLASAETYERRLDEAVARSMLDSPERRLKRLARARKKPKSHTTTIVVFDRNPDVIAVV